MFLFVCICYRILKSTEINENIGTKDVNSFHATVLFLYPLKLSENLWFSNVFRGHTARLLEWNVLKMIIWDRVFKNGPTKICGWQPLRLSSTNFTWSILKYFVKFVSFLTNFTSCYSSPVFLRFTDIVSEKLIKKNQTPLPSSASSIILLKCR